MIRPRTVFSLLAIIAVVLFNGWLKQQRAKSYAYNLIGRSFATDLLANTNSDRVRMVDSWSETNFSAFLTTRPKVEAVKIGDKPSDFFSLREHAAIRLCFTNQMQKHFELRLRAPKGTTNFEVIGALWD